MSKSEEERLNARPVSEQCVIVLSDSVQAGARFCHLLAQHALVGDVIGDRGASLDLVRNRLRHHRNAVDNWTHGCA